jgi:hypothetical protein
MSQLLPGDLVFFGGDLGHMGMYIGVLCTWGKFVSSGYLNAENAERYIKFLTERLNRYENIIWIVGGDIRGDKYPEVWDIMGRSLKKYSPGKMVGYHPFGRTSSTYWFNDCDWLDFNMFQSGHRRYDQINLSSWDEAAGKEPWHGEDNYRYAEIDLARLPLRPVLDGEPSYEHIPQGLQDSAEPYWQEHHVRRYAWWSVLAGSCGHTYGDNSIFQFYTEDKQPIFGVIDTWDQALHHTGSGQMQILKELMLELDFTHCEPMQQLLGDGQGERHDMIRLFGDSKTVVAYNYSGRQFTLIADMRADAWWIDPANGARSYFGRFDLTHSAAFTPPVKKIGHNDWALLLLQ